MSLERTLYYIPLLHKPEDFGSLGTMIYNITLPRSREELMKCYLETFDGYWASIRQYVSGLRINRIYQDGWAGSSNPMFRIVELAVHNTNYQVILELMNRGAELMKTDDPSLLLKELGLLSQPNDKERERVLEERNQYIANTINTTLQSGETGVLFLGPIYDIYPPLDNNLNIIAPMTYSQT